MNIEEVVAKAAQILDEERRFPTAQYSYSPDSPIEQQTTAEKLVHKLTVLQNKEEAKRQLLMNRATNPRTILKANYRFQFSAANYELLVKLLGRISEKDKPTFLEAVGQRIDVFPASIVNKGASFPAFLNQTSELPLVAEFLIRNGGKQVLFDRMRKSKPSPGLATMLLQLGEMIALNYQVLSESEYSSLTASAKGLLKTAYDSYHYINTYGYALEAKHWSEFGINGNSTCESICDLCLQVIEMCRKACFLYLESALNENINLEVNQDKYVVVSYLERFGFSGPLLTALSESEKLNSPVATESDLKSSLGHLRSFLEHLHSEAMPKIQSKKKIPLPVDNKWGTLLTYFRTHGFLSEQEEKFVAGLFAVISDEGVHPLIAKWEYARLSRNVVIEYALLFLRKLERLTP